MSVSKSLVTHPSPSTLTLTYNQITVFGIWEGWVRSCIDTDIDYYYLISFFFFYDDDCAYCGGHVSGPTRAIHQT